MPGRICTGVLSGCVTVCILYVNHSTTSLRLRGQIKLSRDLKDFSFIVPLFRVSRRLAVLLYPVYKWSKGRMYIYRCSQRYKSNWSARQSARDMESYAKPENLAVSLDKLRVPRPADKPLPRPADKPKHIKLHARVRTIISEYDRN